MALGLPPCGLCFQEERGSRARMDSVVFRILTQKTSAGNLLVVRVLLNLGVLGNMGFCSPRVGRNGIMAGAFQE